LVSAQQVSFKFYNELSCKGPPTSLTVTADECTEVKEDIKNSKSLSVFKKGKYRIYTDATCQQLLTDYPGGYCYNLPDGVQVGSIYYAK